MTTNRKEIDEDNDGLAPKVKEQMRIMIGFDTTGNRHERTMTGHKR